MALLPVVPAVLAFLAPPAHAEQATGNPWESKVVLDGPWTCRAGDSAAWADPAYDDSGWHRAEIEDLRRNPLLPRRGVAWFRKEFTLPAGPQAGRHLAIGHIGTLPQEFYWDGELIGRNGIVGRDYASEVPGDGFFQSVPDRLAGPGRHVLAIRLSSFHRFTLPTPYEIVLGEESALARGQLRECLGMLFLAGLFLFAAGYRVLSYRAAGYGRNALLFSLFALSCSAYILALYIDPFLSISEGWRVALRIAMGIAWYGMISLVPDYFVFPESFPYKRLIPAVMIAGVFISVPMTFLFLFAIPIGWYDPISIANRLFTYTTMLLAVWIVACAVRKRQTGSLPSLIGVGCMLAGVFMSMQFDDDTSWAVGVALHVMFLAHAQSLQISERMRALKEGQLRSARLEIELLKKNIQPHFLLNSLNSIIAWLEEDPRTAGRLVNALSDELGMLLRISAEKTITLEEEVRLCRAHLQVMGLRQDKQYEFEFDGGAAGDRLPPMVLHTLVENGITHGYAGKSRGRFRLTREEWGGGVRFSLHNDGATRPGPARKGGEGTGLRYIRSRLEEAFPGRWELRSGPAADGWRVDLIIRGARTAAPEGAGAAPTAPGVRAAAERR